MKIGVEAESMVRDIAAPRRRGAETTPEHQGVTGHPQAPVLIRLPDLYPSARDDAAVARLAGIPQKANCSSPPGPANPPDDGSPTFVSTTADASGHCDANSDLSVCSVQTTTLPAEGRTEASAEQPAESFLPRILLAAERHDLGAHVFRVLMITLLIASLYLVFERTRRDGAVSSNPASSASESGWELSSVPSREAASPSSDIQKGRPERQLARQPDEARPHRVAKRSEPGTSSSEREPQRSNRNRQASNTTEDQRESAPTTANTRVAPESQRKDDMGPDESFVVEPSRSGSVTSPSRAKPAEGDESGYFPSTPVNFDEFPQQRAGNPAWNAPEIPWESSSRYQEPAAGTSAPSPQWERNSDPPHTERSRYESGRTDDYIPPYTPVTLRPRSEPQYPPPGNYSLPSQPDTPASPYLPPTSFSPPASTSNNASGWPMETFR